MNKLAIFSILSLLLLVSPVSAVVMFVNWADGESDTRDFVQGADITFNYESFAFGHDVETEILLIDSLDPANTLDVLIERTDYEGHYGFKIVNTDGLAQGTYAIFGTATDLTTQLTSVDEVAFTISSTPAENNAPYWDNLPTYFEYKLSDVEDILVNLADHGVDPDGNGLFFSIDESNTNENVVECNVYYESSLFCVFIGSGTTTLDVIVSDGDLFARETITIKVEDDTPINVPPYWFNVPSQFEYDISESPVNVMQLENYATDDDGDHLTFSVEGGDGIVDCGVGADSWLTCTLLSIGSTELDLTVSDSVFTDTTSITIIVTDSTANNNAPYFNALPNFFEYAIGEGDADVVDLSQYAVDPDGDSLTFSVTENANNVDCSIQSDSILHCDFNAVGQDEVTVTVSDGSLTGSSDITISIVADPVGNTAPFWDNLPFDYSEDIQVGTANFVQLSNYAVDNDGDTLSYLLDESNTNYAVADCYINQYTELICFLNGVGSTTVDVIVSDGELSDLQTLTITVTQDSTQDNMPPVWDASLANFFSYELSLGSVSVFQASDYVTDPEGDALTFTLDQSGTNFNVLDCSLDASTTLNCNLNGVGTTTLDVIASDGEFSVAHQVTIEVYDTNSAPQFVNVDLYHKYNLSQQVVTVMDLDDHIFDAQGDVLNVNIDETNTDFGVVDCYINQDNELICFLNGVGTTTFDVFVNDGEFSDQVTITIEVCDDNNAPYFDSNLVLNYTYDIDLSQVDVVDLANFAFDLDGDILAYGVDESGTNLGIVDCFIAQTSTLRCNLNGLGSTTLEVIVTDGSLADTATIVMNVIQGNAPHTWDLSIPTYFNYDLALNTVTVMDIANYVIDDGMTTLSYSVDQSGTNTGVVDCAINNGSELICNLVSTGITTVDLVVTDGSYTITQTVTIEVFAINTPPYFDLFMPTYFEYGLAQGQANVVRVSDYVTDDQNDPLTYFLDTSSTDNSVVDCNLQLDTTLHCTFNGLGTTTVDVVVSDNEFSVTQTLTIRIYDNAAVAVITGPTSALVGEVSVFDGLLSTGSQGSPIVSYDWIVDENGTLYSGSGATISHTFSTVGSHTVTLTVTDAFNVSDTEVLTLSADILGPTAIINAESRTTVGAIYSFDGLQSYTHPGVNITNYLWRVYDGNNLLIATFSGASQSMTFVDQDEYTLELTIIDGLGRVDVATFALQARYGAAQPKDFGPEDGIKVSKLELYGTGFEQAKVGDDIVLVATVQNVADNVDFEDVRMTFIIPELGFKVKSKAVDLDEGERKTIQIFTYLPEYVEEGIYYPLVEISDTEVRRSKPMYLEVVA